MEIEKLSGRGWLRVLVAVIGVGALIVIAVRTESDASDERDSSEASAIRLAEIYTEGAFFALTAVGFVLCAYVLTRAGEGDDPGSSPDELAPGEEEEARDDEDEWHEEEEEASTLPDEDAEHEKICLVFGFASGMSWPRGLEIATRLSDSAGELS